MKSHLPGAFESVHIHKCLRITDLRGSPSPRPGARQRTLRVSGGRLRDERLRGVGPPRVAPRRRPLPLRRPLLRRPGIGSGRVEEDGPGFAFFFLRSISPRGGVPRGPSPTGWGCSLGPLGLTPKARTFGKEAWTDLNLTAAIDSRFCPPPGLHTHPSPPPPPPEPGP